MGSESEESDEDYGKNMFDRFDSKVSDEIFYSVNFSLEVFLQQQDRIHRISQVNDCEYYILLSTSKMDMKVRKALDEKKQLRKEMLVDWIKD
jgi:1-deoxy-D-xylulose 5-phosphate reductoisomerase